MAKRSDFAQKLLDDLRLRKERLAAAQASGGPLNAKARDSYAYSKQAFRGSTRYGKAAVTVENIHSQSKGMSRSLPREESTQLVPFGRCQGSQQIGDLSMALALALENGGKLRQFNSSGKSSVLTFQLPKMGRTDLQSQGNHSRTPSLTHLHIQEISKGAQKLNQILRACSNGLNFDKYSVEIGKELLKGAMDLQQALQMLVNLQEASESMVQPRRTSRIVLLEDDKEVEEDESVNGMEQKQLDLLPRFSFDKPTRPRHPQKQQRLPALIYPSESTLNSIPAHKRSTSYGSESRAPTTLQEKQNASSSLNGKVGKGRMSNVIAKLMGLEEASGNIDSDKDQTRITKPKTRENVGPVVSSVKRDTTKPSKINPVTPSEAINFIVRAEKNIASHSSRNAAAKFQEKTLWKNPESVKAITATDQALISPSKRHEKNYGLQNRQDRKRTEETEMRLPLQERVEQKERKTQAEKRDQKRTGSDGRSGQSYATRSLETPKEKQAESEKRMVRQKKGNEAVSRAPSQRAHPATNQPKVKKYLLDEAVHLKKSKEFPQRRQGPQGGKIVEQDKVKALKINGMRKAHGTTFEDVAKPPPHRSTSREAKQLDNGEAYIARPTRTETTKEVRNNAVEELKREAEMDTPTNLNLEDSPCVKKMGQTVLLSPVTDDQRSPADFDVDKELGSAKVIPNTYNGSTTGTLSKLHEENLPVPEIHEPLTGPETLLKSILSKSRLFLNTVEALFKLNIPIGILKASGQDFSREDEDNRLSLDCAFEIIKRTGRRLELTFHPLARKAWISVSNIMDLDDVVRKLFKSFEGLKAHGREGWHDWEVEDYFPRMLELDVCTRNPETDCMWDFGWDALTFAILEKDEVVKDVERLMTSGLIDDMARDLLLLHM